MDRLPLSCRNTNPSRRLLTSIKLTPDEQSVVARGRNANLTVRKKNKGDATAYQDSTAFEALLGYTYIRDKDRFNEIIDWVKTELDDDDCNSTC